MASSLNRDDPVLSNEQCLSDSAQLLYSLSEVEDEDENGGDLQRGVMVHTFSTPPLAAAAIPPTGVVEEASSLETDRRLPTRILIADDSSMNRLVDSSYALLSFCWHYLTRMP